MKRYIIAYFTLLYAGFIQLSAQNSYNYAEVLQKSIFFYECQRSGPLPATNRVSWRGHSAINDGQDVGHDLAGGWYDAGDHVKFGFPMAFSATVLALGGIEYEQGYKQSGQWEYLLDNLRWVNDYFIKCHTGPNELYGQVGNGQVDHAWWGSAEVMQMERPSYKIDQDNPGTELAAETAAAMAAASIIFSKEDPAYSAELIKHAKELYDFADNYRGSYSDAIPDAAAFYRSWSGYNDEIVWGAIFLYMATGDEAYLKKAEEGYANLNTEPQSDIKSFGWTLAWDDKGYGCYVLLAKLTEKVKYKEDAERWLDFWTTGAEGKQITYTPGGLAWLDQWGSLRYSANTSFMAMIYSDITEDVAKKKKYYDFAVSQINYMLGDNPNNRSYVVGFGINPPENPHHRTAHGTWTNNLKTPEEMDNRHILYGALVGGPSTSDKYEDDRGDYIANEVACDYNACFTGVIARMVQDFGGEPLTDFPIEEEPKGEFGVLGKINAQTGSFTQVAVSAYNHSAWPARVLETFSIRYFINLAEVLDAGFTIDDVYAKLSFGKNVEISELQQWEGNVYFVEITFQQLFAPIGDSEAKAEVQFEIGLTGNLQSGWESTNDWSFQDLDKAIDYRGVETPYIPMYENGVLLSGQEPEGGDQVNQAPSAIFSISVDEGEAPLEVFFDASASSDPNKDELTFEWDFGDGNNGQGETISHIFTQEGVFTITLEVQDGKGGKDQFTANIVVESTDSTDSGPIALIDISTLEGPAPLEVTFDGSASSDPDGTPLSISWNFGDGQSSSEPITTHIFEEPGIYEVTLLVVDGEEKRDQASVAITVLPKEVTPNEFPTAVFSANPLSGPAPLEVDFDASQSSDPENEEISYSWSFDDNTADSGSVVSHTFTEVGTYKVVLTVTDASGQSDTYEQKIVATGIDPNPDPDTTGACQPNFLTIQGNKLFDSRGEEVRLTGVNWFGFETQNKAFHGLWSRDMYSVLQQIKDLGFNAIRLPWSNEILEDGAKMNSVSINASAQDSYTGDPLNPYMEGLTPLEGLDLVVQWCEENDIKIVLDNHSRAADAYLNENLWYTDEVPEEKWIEDWVFLADRYKDYSAMAVADINNEPHNSDGTIVTWGYGDPATDWAKAAERCAEAIWEVNPNIVICVEGIHTDKTGRHNWWGGMLGDVRDYMLQVSKPEKLMLSHHEYGPEVYKQPWFDEANFPDNLDTTWSHRWSFVHTEEISHLLMGEFGIKAEDAFGGISKTWIEKLMNDFGGEISWTFWCMNPNSGDTGGILQDNWSDIHQWKMDILDPYLSDPIPNCVQGGTKPIEPTEDNITPLAQIVASGFVGTAPFTVTFDGSNSSDQDGDALTYEWDFQGLGTANVEISTFTFEEEGTYVVSLIVKDGKGGTDEAKVTITVQPNVTTSLAPELGNNFDISVFPNPTERNINVAIESSGSSHFELKIMDLTGKVLALTTSVISNVITEIPLDKFSSGVYLLSVKEVDQPAGRSKYVKIMKQ